MEEAPQVIFHQIHFQDLSTKVRSFFHISRLFETTDRIDTQAIFDSAGPNKSTYVCSMRACIMYAYI